MKSSPSYRRASRLSLLNLEHRVVPATWDGGPLGDGTSWQNAVNWAGDTLPMVGEDVTIGPGFAGKNISSSGDVTIGNLECAANLAVGSGTFTVNGTATIAKLTVGGSTFPLNNNLTCNDVNLISGTLDIKAASTLPNLAVSGGAVIGADLKITSSLTWIGGNIRGGSKLETPAGVSSNLTGVTGRTLGRTWDNGGTINYTGAGWSFGFAGELGVVNNQVGGNFNIDGNNSLAVNAGGTINNQGTLKRSGSGSTVVNSGLNLISTGTINVTAGVLGLSSTNSLDGIIDISATAELQITSGTTNVEDGAAFTGAGLVRQSNSTISINGAASMNSLATSSGTLTGASDLTINNSLEWTGGTIRGAGKLITPGSATATLSGGSNRFLGRTWDNSGTINYTGSGWSFGLTGEPGVVNNVVGGKIVAVGDGDFQLNTGGTINNAGLLQRSGAGNSVFQSNVVLNNSGSINVLSGILQIDSNSTNQSTIDLGSGAEFSVNSNTTQFNNGSAVTGAGTLKIGFGTLTLNAAVPATNLSMVGGVMNGAGDLTLSNSLAWTGGAIRGSGQLITTVTSTTSLTGTNGRTLGRTWDNSGMINYTGNGLNFGVAAMELGVLNNLMGGTLTVDHEADFNLSVGGTVNNFGTLTHTGTGVTSLQSGVAFNSPGIVNVTAGTLLISSNSEASGLFTIDAMAETQINANTFKLNSGANFTGVGVLRVNGGTLSIGASVNATVVTMASGTLTGDGDLTISNSYNWTGGTIRGLGKLMTSAATTSSLTGLTGRVLGRTWDNAGILNYSGNGLSLGASAMELGTLNNLGSGTMTVDGEADFALNNGGTVSNAGGFTHTGSGTTQFQSGVSFNCSGTMNLVAGTVHISSNSSLSGPITLATGTELNLNSSTTTFNSGSSTSGDGTIRMAGATVVVGANLAVNNVVMTTGTLSGSSDLTINRAFQWTGGTLRGGGKLITSMEAVSDLTGLNGRVMGRLWENAGIVNYTGNGLSFGASTTELGTLTNQAGGILNADGNQSVASNFGGTVVNQGTFNRSGTGTTTFQNNVFFSNSGAVNVNAGVLQFGYSVANGGQVTIASGASLATTVGNYTQTAGTTTVEGMLDPAGIVDVQAGTLRGTGTVQSNVTNAGTVAPGTSPGKLTINGDYTQSGGLDIEIAGLTPGTLHDQLIVNGKANLAGALTVSFSSLPAISDSYVIIDNDGSDTITGTFAGLPDGSVFNAGPVLLTINYKGGTNANDVVLTVTAIDTFQVQTVTVNQAALQRSLVTSLSVAFSDQVVFTPTVEAAFELKNANGNLVTLQATKIDNSGPGTVVEFAFIGGSIDGPSGFTAPFSLSDGRYNLKVFADKVSNGSTNLPSDYVLMGDPATLPRLYRLFGDGNGDGVVTAADFNAFRLDYGGMGPSIFDYNGDGQVNANDFNQFRLRYGVMV